MPYARPEVRRYFMQAGWFSKPGAYVLVDGQFGSTGKGLLASILGEVAAQTHVDVYTTNAGPNSGHTAVMPGGIGDTGDITFTTQQLPVAACVARRLLGDDFRSTVFLNGGAVIDEKILFEEASQHRLSTYRHLRIHPSAAMIEQVDRDAESKGNTAKVATTAKGVGSAIARKIMRGCNTPSGMVPDMTGVHLYSKIGPFEYDWTKHVVFVETAQGFSLGINQRFYPYCTSRECTVQQALSDANIPARRLQKVIMSVRTYPIRVGNTANGHSGDCYPDQREIQWSDIGVKPELTTVTKRVRRVFTWSRQQFREAVAANEPDAIFLNFAQYMNDQLLEELITHIFDDYEAVLGWELGNNLLIGAGPRNDDVIPYAYGVGM